MRLLSVRVLETAKPGVAALALCASLGLYACGSGQAPTDNEAVPSATQGGAYLAFSPTALSQAAKLAGEAPSTSRLVKPSKGAKLQIKEDGLKVVLTIRKHSVTEPVTIHMTVFGSRLSDLVIAFEPSDLQFERTATLSIQVDADRIDIPLSSLEAYHLFADGTVTEANLVVKTKGGKTKGRKTKGGKTKGDDDDEVTIEIEVPGFSRYGVQNSD